MCSRIGLLVLEVVSPLLLVTILPVMAITDLSLEAPNRVCCEEGPLDWKMRNITESDLAERFITLAQ
jgi:hypothetical protein